MMDLLLGTGLVLLAVPGVIFLVVVWKTRLPVADTIDDVTGTGWNKILLDGSAPCCDGSTYYAMVRKGSSDNLIIYFQGGGFCWGAVSASTPSSYRRFIRFRLGFSDQKSVGFYIPRLTPLSRLFYGGAFDWDNTANPFRDWSVVHVSYAAADLHMGEGEGRYPVNGAPPVSVYHHGASNAGKVVDWIYKNFPSPAKILIAGGSAGAFGAAIWARPIAEHYADVPIIQLSDGFHAESNAMASAVKHHWKARPEERFGLSVTADFLEGVYRDRCDNPLPNVRYLRSATTRDMALAFYHAWFHGFDVLKDRRYADAFEESQKASLRRTRASNIDCQLYLTDYRRKPDAVFTPHTLFETALFFSVVQDGIGYGDWLRANVIDDQRLSVGTDLLSGSAKPT